MSDPGKVYVLTDGGRVKVGASVDPGRRLGEVRETNSNVSSVTRVGVSSMSSAEAAAQRAVEGMGATRGTGDWYNLPQGTTPSQVAERVESAVQNK